MRWLVALLLGIALLTSGCTTLGVAGFSLTDPQASQVHNQGTIIVLEDAARVFTQSFTTPNTGLNSLTFWASRPADEEAQGRLFVALFAGGDPVPFYSRSFSAQVIQQNTPLRLAFEPRADPPSAIYTLKLTAEGAPFEIHGRIEDIYGDGMAALDGIPFNADLAFSTTYAYTMTALQQDVQRAGDWAGLVLPLFAILFLPGWLLLELAGLRSQFDGWENAALSAGLSLALLPLLMLLTTLLQLPWRTTGLWIAVAILFALLGTVLLWRRTRIKLRLPTATSLALGIVLLLSVGVRVVMVRDMTAPAWVDSVHHALLGRLVAEAGVYPASYEPYFELETTRYHPGFHVSLAALMLLSGEDPAQALLILGQVLNMLAVLSAYLFTTTLTKDKRAGVAAALAVGLFSPMPAYFTSWGRYSQLAGMLILPVPVALWRRWIERTEPANPGWAYPLLTSLAMGGLFMVHYRVAAFAGLLLLPDWLASLPRHRKPAFRFALSAGMLFLLFTFPWLIPMLTRTLLPATHAPVAANAVFMGDFPWGNLTANHGKYLLYLAGAALPIALWLRQRIALLLPVWVGLMLLLANLSFLGLPGGNLVNNTSVAISLYLPVAVLAGFLVSEAIHLAGHYLPTRFHRLGKALLILGTLGLGIFGGRQLVSVLNPNLNLVRPSDLTAIAWAQENLPAHQTVLVNPFLWGYGVYAGGDGGYWLSALAGLPTLPPPVIHAMEGSTDNLADPPAWIAANALNKQVLELAQRPEELHALLQSHAIGSIFLGARGGALLPSLLQQSGLFERLYANEGVYIFAVK